MSADQEQAPVELQADFEKAMAAGDAELATFALRAIPALVTALKAANERASNAERELDERSNRHWERIEELEEDYAKARTLAEQLEVDRREARDDLTRVEAEATQFREERDWETDKRGRAETRIAEVTAERDRLQAWNDSLYYGEIQARTKERDERITELEGSLRGGVEIGFPATKASRNALVNWLEGAKGVLEGGKSK